MRDRQRNERYSRFKGSARIVKTVCRWGVRCNLSGGCRGEVLEFTSPESLTAKGNRTSHAKTAKPGTGIVESNSTAHHTTTHYDLGLFVIDRGVDLHARLCRSHGSENLDCRRNTCQFRSNFITMCIGFNTKSIAKGTYFSVLLH